ncbi:TRAP transporter large permease [Thermovirga sp.]|uniref:TRAP transporter large permease n=1 Tax=Thermovirga sp. TaxID=2699834 RepID=UPI0025DBAA08|nr:TRAP transporter large permease [Thermovirga sp.]
MSLPVTVLLDFMLLVTLLILGVPLPFCFGGALWFMSVFGNVAMASMMMWGFNQMINMVLLASPLFIFAGLLMANSGIADKLLDFVDIFVGRVKGGLGVVCVVTCAIIGAISGSGFTGVAATGPIMIPRMVSQGYPRGYATALVTVSSILGLLIPPSVIMIIYGWITETSILACFLATVGPGILITALFSVINLFLARRMPNILVDSPEELSRKRKEIPIRFVKALPALSIPVVILGGIYGGVFTPTEAAAVAAIIALPVGFFIYKGLTTKNFVPVVRESATSVGAIMTMIIFTLILSQTFVMLRVPQMVVQLVFKFSQNYFLILFLINIFLFFVGMIVNDVTGIILLAPLLLPLVKEMGMHPIQLAAIMGTNLAMGGVTPPYASILYLGMRVGNCEFTEILKPTMTFLLLGYVPVVFLTTYWPPLSMWLPTVLGYVK